MQTDLAQRIAAHPKYQELKAKRTSFGWWLTLAMMVCITASSCWWPSTSPSWRSDGQRRHDAGHARSAFGVIVFTVIITASTCGAPTASSTN
jgi:hypothetical protein